MKQNIIVIEENDSVRYLLSTVLQHRYKVFTFSDCYEAFSALSEKEINLVILSVNDKDHAGLEFLFHLQSSSIYSNLPVIIITRSDIEIIKQQYSNFDYQIGGFFGKPFDPLSVVNKINELLTPVRENYTVSRFRADNTQSLKVRMSSNPHFRFSLFFQSFLGKASDLSNVTTDENGYY